VAGESALLVDRAETPRVFQVQGNERQRPPIVHSEGQTWQTWHRNEGHPRRGQEHLDFDSPANAADIAIKNMNGDVALNGSVPSCPQYREATARRVHGMTSGHNHLMVILPPPSCRDDPALTTAANNPFALNIRVLDVVEATVGDGSVSLTGTARDGSQRKAAVRPAGPSGRTGRCSR
jgi:hypothetical protein